MAASNSCIDEVTLVGCGSMGSALLRGWLRSSDALRFNIVAPHRETVAPYLDNEDRVKWYSSPEGLGAPLQCLVVALKPMVLEEVLPLYKGKVDEKTLIISVATGKTLAFYKEHLGQEIVRAMPNTPVSINQGVIGLAAAPKIYLKFRTQVDGLLGSLGYLAWLESEEQLNQVTALSGSGPAYVFYMIESMAQAGEGMGLSASQAYEMALHTVAGAGAYAVASGLPASVLRDNVTSPKGTTEQALKVLMNSDGLEPLMSTAMQAALNRAKELAK